jgi:integrase
MRNSEVCNLKSSNVDLEEGTLRIIHSKGDKDRLVYLADDVWELLRNYKNFITDNLGYLPIWFFPSRSIKTPINKTTLDQRFNMAWCKTPFSGTCKKKPTVHSLRHSYVVDRMNSWLEDGLEYDQMMIYLSKYLGHSGINESMYYYHLNEDANKIIRRKDHTSGRVIPGVEKYER